MSWEINNLKYHLAKRPKNDVRECPCVPTNAKHQATAIVESQCH